MDNTNNINNAKKAKKALAVLLCLVMILSSFAGCGKKEMENDGAEIKMYIRDPVYNFDPAEAYKNEAALKVVSLMFDNLFIMNSNGKVEKSLVKSYKIDKEKNSMFIELRTDTFWSDGNAITANDVVFAWQRLLDPANSFEAASLLYDIKNAKAAKEGLVTIDDIGISALNNTDVEIIFEDRAIDYDSFINKLTSYALVPLRDDVLSRSAVANDWAKSPTLMVSSGPFRLRTINYKSEKPDPKAKKAELILERNAYYRRDFMEDAVDKAVTPFRLIVDFTKTGDEIMTAFEAGEIFFVGDIPLSSRSKHTLEEWKKIADVSNALSTHTYILNENAEINGVKLFSDKNVRTALSLAINRQEIANAIVFAEAASGIVPNGVFNANNDNKTFREASTSTVSANPAKDAALAKLAESKITPSKFAFSISVPAYDEVHIKIAEMVAASWCDLGFKVTVNKVALKDNSDKALTTGEKIAGVKDDIFAENLSAGKFEVAAIDYVAYSADAFSTLALFAKGYAGTATGTHDSPVFEVKPHISGYDNATYVEKIAAAEKETNPEARATILHEAEAILLEDMPVIPIVFNMNVTMQSKELSDIDVSYYQTNIFTKTELKDYEKYLNTVQQ